MSRNHALDIIRNGWERGWSEQRAAIALMSQLGWPESRAMNFAELLFRQFEEAEEQGIEWQMPPARTDTASLMITLAALALFVCTVVGIGYMISG